MTTNIPTTLLGLPVAILKGFQDFNSAYNQKTNLEDEGNYYVYQNPLDKLFYVLGEKSYYCC